MSTSQKLERLHLTNKVKLTIPDDVIYKIKYLCKSIAKDEWSGVLFYQVEGSIKDTANMNIILKDILLMDKGDKTNTKFNWDEDVVEYQMNNPESIEWLKGHIHSHNTMAVFFSGTDWDELNDNCTAHNFYLSVIVNNFIDIEAKVAFTAESTNKYSCKDEDGNNYILTVSHDGFKPYMFTYDCVIDIPEHQIVVPDEFKDRITLIEEKAAKKAQEASKSIVVSHNTTYPPVYKDRSNKRDNQTPTFDKYNNWGDDYREASYQSSFPGYDKTKKENSESWKEAEEWKNFMQGGQMDNTEEVDVAASTIEQQFAVYILRLGNTVDDDELIDALEDIEESKLSGEDLCNSIMQMYGALHETFFDKMTKYQSDDAFLDVLEEVIGIYEEHLEDYPFLTPTIVALKETGNKLVNYLEEKNGKVKS